MKLLIKNLLTISFVCALAISHAYAAPGDLDPTFANGGKFSFGFGGEGGYASAVVVQADGKIVVAATGASPAFVLLRYNGDGTRDSSFGTDGEVITWFFAEDGGFANAQASGLALQADGKIIAVGASYTNSGADAAIARYNPDGSLDGSFGNAGKLTTDFGTASDFWYAVAVQPDGKILAAGTRTTSTSEFSYVLARYNTDGSPDAGFNNGAGRTTTFIAVRGSGPVDPVGMAVQPDGKIVLTGSVSGGGALNGYRLARYTTEGILDDTFGTGGKVQTSVSAKDRGYSVAILPGNNTVSQPDKIVVGGTSFDGIKDAFTYVRYKLDGTPDAISFTEIPDFGSAEGIAIGVEQRGLLTRKIVLAGNCSRVEGGAGVGRFAVVRLNTDGTTDSTFDNDGVVTTLIGRSARATALTFHAGKIVVVGNGVQLPADLNYDVAIARYDTGGGALDETFNGRGTVLDDIGTRYFTPRAITVQPDGKILIGAAGSTTSGTALARLEPDGVPDRTFAGTGKLQLYADNAESLNALALQPDGKIVTVGSRLDGNDTDFVVARYKADGTKDTSFSGGRVTESASSGNDVAEAVAVQPDGQIVAAGYGSGAFRDTLLMRFRSTGEQDDSFGDDGYAFVSLGIGDDEARAMVLQPDGKIVVAGVADGAVGKRFFVARFTSEGQLDPTFNQDEGVAYVRFPSGDAEATSLAIDDQGRFVVGGFVSNGTNYDFAVARLTPTGALDSSFNNGGRLTLPISKGDDVVNSLLIQPDGRILVAGSATDKIVLGQLPPVPFPPGSFALVRLDKSGALDQSYGNGGIRLLDIEPGTQQSATALALDADGRALVVGYTQGYTGVARFEADLLPRTRFANISTRLRVETGDNVLIGGFIVTGTAPKKLIVRARGGSLGVAGALADPQLAIYDGDGQLIASNDNWQDAPNRQAIIDSGIPPSDPLESAALGSVAPGAYTAVISGVNGGTGVGLVEIYDLDSAAESQLANISTRGLVQTGDDVMIGGFILSGGTEQALILRARGPSLGVAGSLGDPVLQLFNSNGDNVATNDNWRDTQEAEIVSTGIPPSDDFEAAIFGNFAPDAYTAVVRGANDRTGIGLFEVYGLK